MAANVPSQESVLRLLEVEAESGRVFWKPREEGMFPARRHCLTWNARYAGTEAFATMDTDGYFCGTLLERKHRRHQIIWLAVHGNWPKVIDHINGDRSDNRISNLRETDATGNARNSSWRSHNTSGFAGVHKHHNRWVARITLGGRLHHIGLFSTAEEASDAYQAEKRRHGFTRRHCEAHR